MIWRAVDDAALMPEAETLAVGARDSPTEALVLTRQALRRRPATLDAQLDLERDFQREAGRTADFAEGVARFWRSGRRSSPARNRERARVTPQELAEACAEAMWRDDRASPALGMRLERVAPGQAAMSMDGRAETMVNGHGICHGGFIFTLADSAFAFACNTYGERVVSQHGAASASCGRPARHAAGADRERTRARRPLRHLRRPRARTRTARWSPSSAASPAPRHTFFEETPRDTMSGLPDLPPHKDALEPIETRLPRRDRRRCRRSASPGRCAMPTTTCRITAPRSTRPGVHPDDFREPGGPREVPVHHQADLRANYPFGMFAVPREQIARIHASSGTTGKPTVVGYTRARSRHLGAADGALASRRRRAARHAAAQRLWLRAVHRRARRCMTARNDWAAPSSRSPAG